MGRDDASRLLFEPETLKALHLIAERTHESSTEAIRKSLSLFTDISVPSGTLLVQSPDGRTRLVEFDEIQRQAARFAAEQVDSVLAVGGPESEGDRRVARVACQFTLTVVIYGKLLGLAVSEDEIAQMLTVMFATWGLVGPGLNVPHSSARCLTSSGRTRPAPE